MTGTWAYRVPKIDEIRSSKTLKTNSLFYLIFRSFREFIFITIYFIYYFMFFLCCYTCSKNGIVESERGLSRHGFSERGLRLVDIRADQFTSKPRTSKSISHKYRIPDQFNVHQFALSHTQSLSSSYFSGTFDPKSIGGGHPNRIWTCSSSNQLNDSSSIVQNKQ